MKNVLFSSGASNGKIDFASLLLRLGAGISLVYGHGFSKLERVFSDEMIQFADPLGFGEVASFNLVLFAEFFCAALLVLGLLTRWALIPLIINMAVIVLVVHGADEFGMKEISILYLAIFIALFLIGPGRISLDRLIEKRRATVEKI